MLNAPSACFQLLSLLCFHVPQLLSKLASLDRAIAEVTALMSAKVGMTRRFRCSQGTFLSPKHNPLMVPPPALLGLPYMWTPQRTSHAYVSQPPGRRLAGARPGAPCCRAVPAAGHHQRGAAQPVGHSHEASGRARVRHTAADAGGRGHKGVRSSGGWGVLLGGSWGRGWRRDVQFQRLLSIAVCNRLVCHNVLQFSHAGWTGLVTNRPFRLTLVGSVCRL